MTSLEEISLQPLKIEKRGGGMIICAKGYSVILTTAVNNTNECSSETDTAQLLQWRTFFAAVNLRENQMGMCT